MTINQKAVKVLNKLFDAGFVSEKDISGMGMDEILAIQGITIAEIALINELQKSVKTNKVITFLNGNKESNPNKNKTNNIEEVNQWHENMN